MSPEAAARIRQSYLGFATRLDPLLDAFFTRLFSQHPQLRSMFPADLTLQKVRMAASLSLLFRNIDCLGTLEPILMELGAQHARWGVRPEHYPIVRDALLWAIEQTAQPAWGHQLRADWNEAIGRIAALMLKGAAAATLDPPTVVVPRPGPVSAQRAGIPRDGSTSPDGR